ncbi:MAG TPA: DNA mismatch endonuclease Vsr [Acidiphilium sp.]|nr:DNA mismatch endonuclease Vsr [Acidiphilium sp.]
MFVDPKRSRQMALVRHKYTKPEFRVRRFLHAVGFRYRLHAKDLPGRPDLVFPTRKIAVFVHGCFWHRHPDSKCKLARPPKSRLDFWCRKLEENASRDSRNVGAMAEIG